MTTTSGWPKTVRTTIRPTEPVEVSESEYLDLQRSGLLVGSQVTRDDDHAEQPVDGEPAEDKSVGGMLRPPAKRTTAKKAAVKAADSEKGTDAP